MGKWSEVAKTIQVASCQVSVKATIQPAIQQDNVHGLEATTNAQMAFGLNAGPNPQARLVSMQTLAIGTIITVSSPLYGQFEAQTLSEGNDAVVWIMHPFVKSEVAVPREWIVSYE